MDGRRPRGTRYSSPADRNWRGHRGEAAWRTAQGDAEEILAHTPSEWREERPTTPRRRSVRRSRARHRARRVPSRHSRWVRQVAVLVPLALASSSWATLGSSAAPAPSWFPDGYRVALGANPSTTTVVDEEVPVDEGTSTTGSTQPAGQDSGDSKPNTSATPTASPAAEHTSAPTPNEEPPQTHEPDAPAPAPEPTVEQPRQPPKHFPRPTSAPHPLPTPTSIEPTPGIPTTKPHPTAPAPAPTPTESDGPWFPIPLPPLPWPLPDELPLPDLPLPLPLLLPASQEGFYYVPWTPVPTATTTVEGHAWTDASVDE